MKEMAEKALPVQPVVCCVGDHYVICVPSPGEALLSLLVEDRCFDCDDNGVRRSSCAVYKFEVPMELLDRAGEYTILYSPVEERKPYRTKLLPTQRFRFRFTPVPARYPIRVAHLSDVHGLKEEAIRTGSFFHSELDLLILNGDISSSSNNLEEALLPLQIAFALTGGEKPCVITRGNHDLRGKVAEKLCEIYPTDHGRMYYCVSLAGMRLLVLDCGEDKPDSHEEYGGTVCFHAYRERETEFLRAVAQDEAFCRSRLPTVLVSHIPFPHTDGEGEFAIEQTLYAEWCRLLREDIRPDLCLFGHHHWTDCLQKGNAFDTKGIGIPMIIGGSPVHTPAKDVHAAFVSLYQTHADVVFANKKHQVLKKDTVCFE